MDKLFVSSIVVALVVGSGAFYGGMKYGEKKLSSDRAVRFGQFGALSDARRGTRGGGGFISGEILGKDEKSITLKTRDGSSKIVFFSDATEIGKSVKGSRDDVVIGKTVTIIGKSNGDGSVVADSIQVRSGIALP